MPIFFQEKISFAPTCSLCDAGPSQTYPHFRLFMHLLLIYAALEQVRTPMISLQRQ